MFTGACSESKGPARALRVPLPEGWVATSGSGGVLRVGPKGRAVLSLERRSAVLPTLESLRAAVEAEGASVTKSAETADSTAVRYARPGAAEGLLATHTLEGGG